MCALTLLRTNECVYSSDSIKIHNRSDLIKQNNWVELLTMTLNF